MKGERILLIDDDKDMQWLFSSIIGEEGYEVLTTGTGELGLGLVKDSEIHLVFLDLKLPGMDGLTVLKEIKRNNPDLPVVMITGYETVETAVESMRLGAYDYIIKPVSADKIKVTARNALQAYKLTEKVQTLEKKLEGRVSISDIIGDSPSMQSLFGSIRQVGPYDITVLLNGQTGTGKEMAARAIHWESGRRDKPFVAIDCATLPESLIESQLFGHERGAFTGAEKSQIGRFEQADGGTVFLDEVANIPLLLQAKLLRIVERKELTRIGSDKITKVDIRFICATNVDLEEMTKNGGFREDLYHRINVFPIRLPTLKERDGDIALLTRFFMKKHSDEFGKDIVHLSLQAEEALYAYHWPGNVRELENTIKSAAIMAEGEILLEHLPQRAGKPSAQWTFYPQAKTLREAREMAERPFIEAALRKNNGNKLQTAQILGIDYKTLLSRIRQYGL